MTPRSPGAAERRFLTQRLIHKFKAVLMLTIESLSGRVLDQRTSPITVHVH